MAKVRVNEITNHQNELLIERKQMKRRANVEKAKTIALIIIFSVAAGFALGYWVSEQNQTKIAKAAQAQFANYTGDPQNNEHTLTQSK